jgi:hypothetical protein
MRSAMFLGLGAWAFTSQALAVSSSDHHAVRLP